jgi:hypothetical protein
MAKTHHIFISHSWSYGDSYDNLKNLLNNRSYFPYRDYSVPKNSPIHTTGTKRELREAIKNKLSPTNVMIVLAGVYSTYSDWIKEEIDIANNSFSRKKPILAIRPWASKKISSIVQDNSDLVVGWNTESVVNGIRKLDKS